MIGMGICDSIFCIFTQIRGSSLSPAMPVTTDALQNIEEVPVLSNYLYAEINIVGIALLLLLLNNMNRNGSKDLPIDQRIFSCLMFANVLIFVFDTGMWLLDGNPHPGSRAANYVVTSLYYLFNPLICFLWLMYTDFKVYESRSGLLKRSRLYAIPAAVSAVISLASPFGHWYFIIDEGNHYMRGPLFSMMAFAALFYLALSCGISLVNTFKNGWEENTSVNIHLVVFPIAIIAAAAIQIMFFGVSIIWVCSMLALVSIYINIQNREISTDHLTILYNRRRLDQHLQRRIKTRSKDRLLFAIMLDLDDFKSINDQYGHIAGDSVLVKTAELLRQACKGSDDFIARMGGDEFVIVGERTESGEIMYLMGKIHACTLDYNQSRLTDYNLLLSMGYSVFGKDDSVDTFLAAADKEMYRNKQERKLAWGRERSPARL
jgi:diguanylate cyclase (GGDEF) domain